MSTPAETLERIAAIGRTLAAVPGFALTGTTVAHSSDAAVDVHDEIDLLCRYAMSLARSLSQETSAEGEDDTMPGKVPTTQREMLAQMAAELTTWRWLHWGKAGASWACPCGAANGAAIDRCPNCDTPQPSKDVPLTAGICPDPAPEIPDDAHPVATPTPTLPDDEHPR